MSLMQAPVGIMILHRTMVQEELDRNRHLSRTNLPLRRRTPLMLFRAAIGRTLIAAGTRLDPTAGMPAPATPALRT